MYIGPYDKESWLEAIYLVSWSTSSSAIDYEQWEIYKACKLKYRICKIQKQAHKMLQKDSQTMKDQ